MRRGLRIVIVLALSSILPRAANAAMNDGDLNYYAPSTLEVSYPLIASVSLGLAVPLVRDFSNVGPTEMNVLRDLNLQRLVDLAAYAKVDLGIGGVMGSAGIYVPYGGEAAVTLETAALRAWGLNLGSAGHLGPESNLTYVGGIAGVSTPCIPEGVLCRLGLGYFRSTEQANQNFIYTSIGLGFGF